jgi:hypothetical protein
MEAKTKHTPGPWVADTGIYPTEVRGPRREIITYPQRAEDTALLAAAPELLSAAWVALHALTGGGGTKTLGGAVEVLRAAIAKAEGRDQ